VTPCVLVHLAATAQPRTLGLVPALLFADLPDDAEAAVSALGVSREQVGHARGGGFQADLDVPEGSWRFWPSWGVAAWLGRSPSSMAPRTAGSLRRGQLDLLVGLGRLLDRGFWASELRLLHEADGWMRPLSLRAALEGLAAEGDRIQGVSGLFSDGHGRAARVELFSNGQAWASTPVDAERWLLVASGLADE
jgi:hypothetical protein